MVGSGGICVWLSLESGGRFCVGAFGRNMASVEIKMFTNFIHFIRRFVNLEFQYDFYTAATACITAPQKKG
jgi:hypothetical protein